jgi:hypothetical protein
MKLNVKDIVGSNAISMQSGERLYNEIHQPLLDGEKVQLDFTGVDLFASPFFNASIGLALKDINIEDLQKNLELLNFSPVGRQLLNHVIANAINFYNKDSGLADILNAMDKNPDQG